ncbi:MAG: Uma2 family endonuclease [Planctomycetes bacterium]|nr:Uma2 family endonuclease [Planctomycetota bacterium]
MSAAHKINRLAVEDYLAGELTSSIKHEYVGGIAYAMAGARNVHNRIVGNIFGSIFARLRGKPCQPFNSDTKMRIRLPGEIRFYYPDVSVVCDPNRDDESFQDQPIVIFEVLSRGTRRIDEGEKKDAYLAIPSLAAYVLVEQEFASVVVWRRTGEGFVPQTHDGLNAILPLTEIATELPLAEIYQGVSFVPEAGT